VPPLQRALPLAEVDDLPEAVAEDLDLHVPRLGQVLLEVEGAVRERPLGLHGGELERGRELLPVPGDAHPAPAAARDRLQQDRVADPLGDPERLLRRGDRTGTPGNRRDARLLRRVLRRRLVAHPADRVGRRADPGEADLLEDLREVRVLGEEPVARMDRVGPGDLRRRDERRDVEVGGRGGRRPDADRFVGGFDVQGVAVDRRVDGDGRDAELLARGDDPQGDLPAVRDEDLAEHQAGRIPNSFSPNSTGWPFFGKASTIVPATSASISFISFIASMMQSVAPFSTVSPIFTNGSASGFGAR
jgi:hypothetical protein